jgi:ABC-type spermidine/putrescine transport system permease subunit II
MSAAGIRTIAAGRRSKPSPAASRIAIALGVGAIVLLYAPVLWLAVMSVSERPLSGVPWPLSFRWYEDLLRQSSKWLEPLELSLLIGIIVGVLCMGAATVVGRVLPRLQRRGGLLMAFLIPLFVPGVVAGAALFMFYKPLLGFKMGVWSLILGHFVWAFPFALLTMLVVTTRFDYRLLEAAQDLGASNWQRFWQIEAPLLKPGIVACGFFGFLLSFNELPRSIFLRAGQETLPLYLWAESASHVSSVHLIYALSTLIAIGSIMLTVAALRLLFFGGGETR